MVPANQVRPGIVRVLSASLLEFPELHTATTLILAYSGGLDSTVLLHLLSRLKQEGHITAELQALHVHHGLQADADTWLDHCRMQAEALGIGFVGQRVTVIANRGESQEEAARNARYAVFARMMEQGGLLLQAHHLDDQVETVLLHLFRGSGPLGLAGIPASRPLAAGHILRPLLGHARGDLLQYAREEGLNWIEDPSNRDEQYDRNFLRQGIMPLLQQRWPAVVSNIGKSATLCSESADLNRTLAEIDLLQARMEQPNRLRLDVLIALPPARLRNLLKYWTAALSESLGGESMSFHALQRVATELLHASADADPVIAWGTGARELQLRRFADALFLLQPLPVCPQPMQWHSADRLELPGALGSLVLNGEHSGHPVFEVRFRDGGEQLRIRGRHTKTLKNLLQEAAVPPWLRGCVPLVYFDNKLVAVADIVQGEDWPLTGVEIIWRRSELHCGY